MSLVVWHFFFEWGEGQLETELSVCFVLLSCLKWICFTFCFWLVLPLLLLVFSCFFLFAVNMIFLSSFPYHKERAMKWLSYPRCFFWLIFFKISVVLVNCLNILSIVWECLSVWGVFFLFVLIGRGKTNVQKLSFCSIDDSFIFLFLEGLSATRRWFATVCLVYLSNDDFSINLNNFYVFKIL